MLENGDRGTALTLIVHDDQRAASARPHRPLQPLQQLFLGLGADRVLVQGHEVEPEEDGGGHGSGEVVPAGQGVRVGVPVAEAQRTAQPARWCLRGGVWHGVLYPPRDGGDAGCRWGCEWGWQKGCIGSTAAQHGTGPNA